MKIGKGCLKKQPFLWKQVKGENCLYQIPILGHSNFFESIEYHMERNRLLYLLFVFTAICLGLLSRAFIHLLPHLVNLVLGDAIWAFMIYMLLALIFHKRNSKQVAGCSLLFCYAIEVSQLYHAPWIDAIRNTTLGALVLGFGFLPTDLLAYTIGIAAACAFEWFLQKVVRKDA